MSGASSPIRPGKHLELELRPPRRARVAATVFVFLSLAFTLDQLLQGRLLLAVFSGIATLAGGGSLLQWVVRYRSGRLVVEGSGAVRLETSGGPCPVTLDRRSLRLGPHLLLVLRSPAGRSFRLLLGPDNLAPAELAALRRRLRRLATGVGLLG